MLNLLAYIPTVNPRHLEWLGKYPSADLFLIDQSDAQKLLPRLSRNMAALPTGTVRSMLQGIIPRRVKIFDPEWETPDLDDERGVWKDWILPDEDVSHLAAERYLLPVGCNVQYEMIWARYDMSAIKANQPVVPDAVISVSEFNREMMQRAERAARKSPDWWRQVGAVAVEPNGDLLAVSYNTHMPNEYETYIFGDPGLNRDAGEKGKYTVLHAEQGLITACARNGLAMEGAHVYVTTFPCENCARELADAGVKKVYYKEGFSSLNAYDVFKAQGMEIVQVQDALVTA
jgi:dCMP deaminase